MIMRKLGSLEEEFFPDSDAEQPQPVHRNNELDTSDSMPMPELVGRNGERYPYSDSDQVTT